MPLLTVRLTDEEYAALKQLAAGTTMADLIRDWIALGIKAPTGLNKPPTDTGTFKPAFRPAPKPERKKR